MLPHNLNTIAKLQPHEFLKNYSNEQESFLECLSNLSTFKALSPVLVLDGFDDANLSRFISSFCGEKKHNLNIILFNPEVDLTSYSLDYIKHLQIYRGTTRGFNNYFYALSFQLKFHHVIYLNNGTLFDSDWLNNTLAILKDGTNHDIIFPQLIFENKITIGFRITKRGFLVPITRYLFGDLHYENISPIASGIVLSTSRLLSIYKQKKHLFDLIFNEYNLIEMSNYRFIFNPNYLTANLNSALSYGHDTFELRNNYERSDFIEKNVHLLHRYPIENIQNFNYLSHAPSLASPILLLFENSDSAKGLDNLILLFKSAGFFILTLETLNPIVIKEGGGDNFLFSRLDKVLKHENKLGILSGIICTSSLFTDYYKYSNIRDILDNLKKMYLETSFDIDNCDEFEFIKIDRKNIQDIYQINRHIYADFYRIQPLKNAPGYTPLRSMHLRIWFEQLMGKSSSLREEFYGS